METTTAAPGWQFMVQQLLATRNRIVGDTPSLSNSGQAPSEENNLQDSPCAALWDKLTVSPFPLISRPVVENRVGRYPYPSTELYHR